MTQKKVADGIYNAGIQHAAAIDTIEQSSLIDQGGEPMDTTTLVDGGEGEPMDTTDSRRPIDRRAFRKTYSV